MQQATYMINRDYSKDRGVRGTARIGTGSKVHTATMQYQTDHEGVERSFGFTVFCRPNKFVSAHGFEPANEDARNVTCGACIPQPRRTEEFYKLFKFPDGREHRVGFSACRAHIRKLTSMLGAMDGATIDQVDDEGFNREDMDPCIICESKEFVASAGLVGLLAQRIVWTGTTLADRKYDTEDF